METYRWRDQITGEIFEKEFNGRVMDAEKEDDFSEWADGRIIRRISE